MKTRKENTYACMCKHIHTGIDRQTDGRTDRQTNGWTDRQTDTQLSYSSLVNHSSLHNLRELITNDTTKNVNYLQKNI